MSRDPFGRAARDVIRAELRTAKVDHHWWQGWFSADELPMLILVVAYVAFFACVVFA